MNKKMIKNYIYNLSYQIVAILVPLITAPYLSRVLGAENIGIYSFTLSITTYFILFGSMGISLYAQREIAYVQENKENRSKLFFEIVYFKFFFLFISLFIFFIIFCLNGEYTTFYRIFIFEIVSNMLDISWFFQGIEEFKKTVLRNYIVKILSVILIFCFVNSQNDLLIYLIIYVFSTLLGNLSLWFYLPKYINFVKFSKLNIFQHFKPNIALFIPQVATQVYTVLDKTMIGILVFDKSEVGFYEQAQKIVKLCLTIATSLGTIMLPRISNMFINCDRKKLIDYIYSSISFILLITFPMMFGLISISNNFVPLFFGDGYDKVSMLLCCISPIFVAIGISNVIGKQYLIPTKQQNKFTISVIIGAIVNFFLNLLLIGRYMSLGASVATVISEISVSAVQLYLVRHDVDLKKILKIFMRYFFASLLMFIFSILLQTIISNPIVCIVLQLLCSILIYMLILILTKDKLIFKIIALIKVNK